MHLYLRKHRHQLHWQKRKNIYFTLYPYIQIYEDLLKTVSKSCIRQSTPQHHHHHHHYKPISAEFHNEFQTWKKNDTLSFLRRKTVWRLDILLWSLRMHRNQLLDNSTKEHLFYIGFFHSKLRGICENSIKTLH